MSEWVPALSLAVFVATIPFLLAFRILAALPKPLALSHRRWPAWGNFLLIGGVTAHATVFIRGVYSEGPQEPIGFVLQFLIAAVIYLFGFAFLLRQFDGLYPEYFVTTGPTGLGMRKVLYRNVVDLDEAVDSRGQTAVRVYLRTGECLRLVLSTRDAEILRKAIQGSHPEL